jgi:hypothetical protein
MLGARRKRPVAAVCFCTKNEGTPKTVACFALIARPHEQAGAVNTSLRRRPHVLDTTRMLCVLSRIRAELAGEFSLTIREVYFMDQSKSVPANDIARNNHTAPAKNIVDTVIAAGNFTIFAAGIKAAGLNEELAAKGPFTVFAPTDEAFKKLPSGSYDLLARTRRMSRQF